MRNKYFVEKAFLSVETFIILLLIVVWSSYPPQESIAQKKIAVIKTVDKELTALIKEESLIDSAYNAKLETIKYEKETFLSKNKTLIKELNYLRYTNSKLKKENTTLYSVIDSLATDTYNINRKY